MRHMERAEREIRSLPLGSQGSHTVKRNWQREELLVLERQKARVGTIGQLIRMTGMA